MSTQLKLDRGVARLFLARPEKANALDTPLLEALLASLHELSGRKELRVVVLGGHGRAFCGGADVAELSGLTAATAGAFVERIHQVCQALRRLPGA